MRLRFLLSSNPCGSLRARCWLYRRRSSWNDSQCHVHEMSHVTEWLVTNHCIRMITWHCCIDVITTSICCRNKLATWFKHDLVLLPWKGVRIIVVCGVLSARKPIASRDRGNVYLIYHEQCISRLYCRPIYYTFQIPLRIQMHRRLWRIVNGKYKNGDGDLLNYEIRIHFGNCFPELFFSEDSLITRIINYTQRL